MKKVLVLSGVIILGFFTYSFLRYLEVNNYKGQVAQLYPDFECVSAKKDGGFPNPTVYQYKLSHKKYDKLSIVHNVYKIDPVVSCKNDDDIFCKENDLFKEVSEAGRNNLAEKVNNKLKTLKPGGGVLYAYHDYSYKCSESASGIGLYCDFPIEGHFYRFTFNEQNKAWTDKGDMGSYLGW